MIYTEQHKQQLRDWIREGVTRIAFYMETQLGFPREMSIEQIERFDTLGAQLQLIASFRKTNPKWFKDMPIFKA